MEPQSAGGIVRTTKGLIVGAFAIAIALSGALVALLSLGSAVHFDDWPQPPRSGERDVRTDSIARDARSADGVRPANPGSLSSFAGLVPEEPTLVAAVPVEDALLTTDLQGGVRPSLGRRQVTLPRRRPRQREDGVAPGIVPAPAPPAPAPAPGPPANTPVVDKPGKDRGPGERRPTGPPGQEKPKPEKPEKPEKPKPEKPEKQEQEKPGGGEDSDDSDNRSDSRNRVFRATHRVAGRSHDSRSPARGQTKNR